jgi:hypothetical protein
MERTVQRASVSHLDHLVLSGCLKSPASDLVECRGIHQRGNVYHLHADEARRPIHDGTVVAEF